ncbi:hypothetical protein EPW42_03120 [Campylobacter coli]|nr:hypothetical protein [Campylobacter coli]
MKNKAHFISFENLIYKQKNGNFEEDDLFKELTKECDLQNPFEYQLAFLKQDQIYHCFLARVAKLPKTQFCFPQPLVFQSLFLENKIKEENFCILEIKPQKVFLCFYEQGKFKTFKTLDFCDNIEEFINKSRILELLQHYESKILLSTKAHEIFNLISAKAKLPFKMIQEDKIALSKHSIHHLDKNANFIKHYKKYLPWYFKFIFLFALSFIISIVVLSLIDFAQYQNAKTTHIQNEISQNKIYEIQEKQNQKLKANIEQLQLEIQTQNLLLEKYSEQLSKITQNFKADKNTILILTKAIAWLNDHSLRISNLMIDKTLITIKFSNEEDFNKALQFTSPQFSLISQDKSLHEITLRAL